MGAWVAPIYGRPWVSGVRALEPVRMADTWFVLCSGVGGDARHRRLLVSFATWALPSAAPLCCCALGIGIVVVHGLIGPHVCCARQGLLGSLSLCAAWDLLPGSAWVNRVLLFCTPGWKLNIHTLQTWACRIYSYRSAWKISIRTD